MVKLTFVAVNLLPTGGMIEIASAPDRFRFIEVASNVAPRTRAGAAPSHRIAAAATVSCVMPVIEMCLEGLGEAARQLREGLKMHVGRGGCHKPGRSLQTTICSRSD